MTDIKKNENLSTDDYLVCPACEGSGSQGLGFDCSKCGGVSVGVFHNNFFFYWKPKIGVAMIELDHFRNNINKFFNFVSFVIAVLGLLSLAFWLYSQSNISVRLDAFAFWKYKHPLLLFFWLSTIADLFVIYRLSKETLAMQAVKIFKYNDFGKQKIQLNNWDDLKNANNNLKIDVSKTYSEPSVSLIEEAFMLAKKMDHSEVSPLHLFFVALSDREVSAVFSRLNIDSTKLVEKLKTYLLKKETANGVTKLSVEIKKTLIDAYLEAGKWGQRKVTPKNLVHACLPHELILKELLYDLEIDENKIKNIILWFIVNEKQVASYKKFKSEARFKPSTTMDRAYTAVATPILNNFAYDLTIAAKWSKLEYCVSREKEIEEIWDNLESGQNGILLVGPDGVGKKTLMAGVAQKMVEEDVPSLLIDKRLLELDLARLISGVNAAQAEGRMMAIIDEVNRAGNIILFFSNIDNIIGISSGSEGSMDLSEVLTSAIDRHVLFAFASTTSENYLKHLEGKALDLTMAKIQVSEPTGNKAIQIIESKVSSIEAKHRVYFSYSAIEECVNFSSKYMHDSYLPKKALKILEMAAVRISKTDTDFPLINKEHIATIVSEITDIPITKISEDEGKELLNLEEKIHERMISQDEAVKMVSASLRRARTNMREGVRPIANFLFLGPTGVGKTELAKTVSEVYFGDEKYMIRIDMSEYQHVDSIKKMIGDSSGTKGYLTELVRKNPFALILLDEVEKAHPDILNIFLQVMDDGRLTDGQGHLIDFTNSIIIATSNAGAQYIQDEIYKGTSTEEIRTVLINDHLNKVMRPELINRFDGVIVFEPLSLENVVDVTRLMLASIEKMLLSKGMELHYEEEGLRALAKLGFDPKFGARPLRRVLQDRIEDSIANKILSGELQRRDTVVINRDADIVVEKGVAI